MKQTGIYLLVGIVLLLVAGLIFGGCKVNQPGQSGVLSDNSANKTDETSGTGEKINLTLARNGKTDYAIVYPRGAGVSLRRAAQALADCFASVGIEMEVRNDGGVLAANVPDDTCEILLGKTNRAESDAASKKNLPIHGYRTFASGVRLGIVAGDEEQLEKAVLLWIGNLALQSENGNLDVELSPESTVDWDGNCRNGWLLYGIPSYDGGILSSALYDCGYGLHDFSESAGDNSAMQIITNTDAKEFEVYLAKLEAAGYRKDFENRIGNNQYVSCISGGLRVYAYYTAATGICRVIHDKSGVPVSEFGYSYTAKETDETVIYAYALCQSDTGLYSNNCGQLEVIRLADNSLFIIDGGMAAQFDDAAKDGFVEFARRVTGTPQGERIRVSCWFFTHDHGDHRDGLAQILGNPAYASDFLIERLAFNYPATSVGVNGSTKEFLADIVSVYPDCKMLKLHTGMKFTIADLQVEVVATHENLTTGAGKSTVRDFNDTSTVLMLSTGNVRFLLLGDTSDKSAQSIVQSMPAEFLKADIVQVAHHTWNDLPDLYDLCRADYAIFTQTEGASNRTLGIYAKKTLRKIQQYASPEHCYFSGETTTGLLIKNGQVTVKEQFPLCWNTPDYPWTYVYEGYDMSQVKDYADEEP